MEISALYSPYVVDKKGALRFKDHPGQRRILQSDKRFLLMLAGTQSGKTVTGPWWLLDEMKKCGPGDYMVACPTYPLMQKKVLPEFLGLFKRRLGYGDYHIADRIFEISKGGQEAVWGRSYNDSTQVFFGHAQDPDSLESATAKAVWMDEPGQRKFKLGSWEAIQRRLSIYEGRALMTTTPYTLGWLKTQIHDRAKDPNADIELVQFASTMNPNFPRSEYERAERELPRWKFNMMYKGVFERPAGMIYDCFGADSKVKRFDIPDDWPRFVGIDFGGVNTAAVSIARSPETGELFLYRTYHKGGMTSKEHAEKMRAGEPGRMTAYGGAKSEGQWRQEFRAGRLFIHEPPVSDVEVGINRVYALLKAGRLKVFDDLAEIIDEFESYSRELDDMGEPIEKIEDKETYH